MTTLELYEIKNPVEKNGSIFLFDTSAISRLEKIIKEMPKFTVTRSVFSVSAITIYEIEQSGDSQNIKGLRNYDTYSFRTMLDWLCLIHFEIDKILGNDLSLLDPFFREFPFHNKFFEEDFKSYRAKTHVNYFEKREIIKKEINDYNEGKKQDWENIQRTTKSHGQCKTSVKVVDEVENALIEDIKNNNHENLVGVTFEIFKIFYPIMNKFGIDDFKKLCPASHSIIRIAAFKYILTKTGDRGLYDKLSLRIDNKDEISLNINCWPDLKLSVPYLPYIESFITQDKNQANLLKELFPKYYKKILYIPQLS